MQQLQEALCEIEGKNLKCIGAGGGKKKGPHDWCKNLGGAAVDGDIKGSDPGGSGEASADEDRRVWPFHKTLGKQTEQMCDEGSRSQPVCPDSRSGFASSQMFPRRIKCSDSQ